MNKPNAVDLNSFHGSFKNFEVCMVWYMYTKRIPNTKVLEAAIPLYKYSCRYQKSVNLQYNTLIRWADGTNDSSTKHLMFQVHIIFFYNFLQNSLQKS